MNSNTNDKVEKVGVDQIAIAKRLISHAMNDREFRHRTTVDLNDRLCELCCTVCLHGWEAVFEWSDGLGRLNEAIRYGLVWLTTVELLDLSHHIPISAEYCAPGQPRTIHDIAAIADDAFRHEGSGGIETVTHATFSAAFPDQGKPIWKLLAAPNPPQVMVAPNWPTSPQSPSTQLANSLVGVIA
jgi:hypothetical protein